MGTLGGHVFPTTEVSMITDLLSLTAVRYLRLRVPTDVLDGLPRCFARQRFQVARHPVCKRSVLEATLALLVFTASARCPATRSYL